MRVVCSLKLASRVCVQVLHQPYRRLEVSWVANAKSWEIRCIVATYGVWLARTRAVLAPGAHALRGWFINNKL